MSTPIKIYSPLLVELATISAANSAIRKETINADNILNFSLRLRDPSADYINSINVVGLGTDYFDIAWYKKEQQADGTMMINVECEQVSYRLCNSAYAMSYFSMTDTPTNILTALLVGTDFTVGTVDFASSITFTAELTGATEGNQMSLRSVLMQLVNQLGGEVEFSAFSVSILTARGSAGPVVLTVGQDITMISEAIDKRLLDSLGNPTAVYTVGIYDGTAVELGDVVQLTYSTMGISESLRIVSKSYDPYNPKNVSIEAGNYTKTIENLIYDIQTTKASADYVSALEAAVTNLNEVIANSLGYYTTTLTDGVTGAKTTYIHDASTLETSVVIYVMTGSGFAWTDQGWNGGAPVWQYGITGAGNAILNVLTVLGINADWITAGMLKSPDGSTYFDLDNAEIGMESNAVLNMTFFNTNSPGPGKTIDEATGAELPSLYNTVYLLENDLFLNKALVEIVSFSSGYEYKLYAYDNGGVYQGQITTDWSTPATVTIPADGYLKMLVKKSDGSAVSTWSWISWSFKISPYLTLKISPTNAISMKYGDVDVLSISADGYILANGIRFSDTFSMGKLLSTNDTAEYYYIKTEHHDFIMKTLENVKSEIVTKAAVEATLTGAITSHTHSYVPLAGGVNITGNIALTGGAAITGASRKVIYLTTGDCNTIVEEWTVIHPDVSNAPATGYWYMQTILMNTGNNRHQIAYRYNGSDIYRRYYENNSWSSWSKIF